MTKPSLAETHPEVAAMAHGWDPTTATFGLHGMREWECGRGHVWTAIIQSVVRSSSKKDKGCPYCSGRRPIIGQTDLVTTHPELAKQAHGWDPITMTYGSPKNVEWECALGHIWFARVADRTMTGSDCVYCSNRKILVGFNDLATTHPDAAAIAHGWDPATVTAGSDKMREWWCPRGHAWSAVVGSVVRGSGCGVCAGMKVLVGYNDLKTSHPEIAEQAHGWDPATVTSHSAKRLEWQCGRGHVWLARVSNRTRPNGTGCPGCYAMTFDEMTRRPLKFRDQQRKFVR